MTTIERPARVHRAADLQVARYATLQRLLAVGAPFLLGLHFVIHGGVGVGDLIAPVLLAVWVPVLGRFPFAWLVPVVGLITAAWGWWMGSTALLEGYSIDSSWRLQTVALLVSVVTGAGMLLWARTIVPTPLIGAAFGMGMVANAALFGSPSDNPWKFTWGVPVSLVVLSAAAATRRPWVGVVALLGLAGLSAALDCRSYSAALILTTLLVLPSLGRRGGRVRDLPTAAVAAFVVALAGGVYYLGTSLLVSGYLGKDAQARTVEQIRTGGSVILGGRPEISATWALMKHRPAGYGAGVVPTGRDVMVAKGGMRSIGYAPNNNYVERYMFGGHIELHSVFGDLWSSFGIPGLVFTLLVAMLALRGISGFLARGGGDCLLIFPCVWTLWNVGFSPFASSSAVMTLALAVALPRAVRSRSTDEDCRTAHPRAGRRLVQ